MKKLILIIVLFYSLILNTNALGANCEVIMDADTNRVLYSKNLHKKMLIASTTKIMTAIVAINNGNIDDIVTVSNIVTSSYGSGIYIKPGEKLTLKDLLYGLMLRSGNDAALMISEYIGGSQEGFVLLMNETAKNIGMNDTEFNNPHGLDEETQNYSSVYDLALLMSYANKNPIFREITSTKKYNLKTNFNTYIWYNKNKLLSEYKYATGGKIGYTKKAGHTFVSSASKDSKNLIIATIKDTDRFKTHKTYYEEYFNKYKKYKIIDKDNISIDYKDGYSVYTLNDIYLLLNKDEVKNINRKIILYDKDVINNKIGYIDIYVGDTLAKRVGLYSHTKKKLWYKIFNI